jgi:dTMP kinase
MKRGKLITFYGINNIGKSTQCKILIDNLKKHGYDAVYIKYPVYSIEPSGPYINSVLRGSNNKQQITEDELQMWYTINRYQFEPDLKQMLNEGKIIIAEDYTATGLAWGSAKGANLEWLIEINKYLLKEDLAIYLKGKRNLQAKEYNHIHESNDELVEACQFIYDNLAVKFDWKKVNIKPSIGETADDIWETIHKFLKEN